MLLIVCGKPICILFLSSYIIYKVWIGLYEQSIGTLRIEIHNRKYVFPYLSKSLWPGGNAIGDESRLIVIDCWQIYKKCIYLPANLSNLKEVLCKRRK